MTRPGRSARTNPDPIADPGGPVPVDNREGHHPAVEQDKPVGPPPTPRTFAAGPRFFRFAFEPKVAVVGALSGVTPWTTGVTVGDDDLEIRFGLWHLQTPIANVESVEASGPYQWLKVAGPAHLSLADRGVTFATTTRRGACITFREPVPAIEPLGRLRHPGATVTLEDVDEFVSLLQNRADLAAEGRA